MSASSLEILVVLLIFLISIPVNAMVIAYFFNRRWYRRKKRAMLVWLRKRGLIESEEKYTKSRRKF